ncbi:MULTISPECIES: Gfo/Idh/MocA family protein [Inquilinus]|uniref:Dehydrogenase n=1 Tax=Inquilinus ginsengisoli TaxID=363840 RepID=A0ABU1JU74_9PROT|nr:Gfo/Idh/MocA family oxidoreductase [Inquilinus ginsengisoli]MDR6292162.1 putative dehydrogenase [Inquilinus ginsengisoli]
MPPCNFAIVGPGWRTEFFLRAARALPDRFRIDGVVVRDPARGAAFEAQWGLPTFRSTEALLRLTRPRFAVVSVPQPAAPGVIAELAAAGMPVLSETPPAPDLEGLLRLAELVRGGARLQVAEQYFLQPTHAARLALIAAGRIGTPSHAHVSVAHGYHGTSLIRKYLGLGFENAAIRAQGFASPIVASPTRAGPPDEFRIARSEQTIATLDFGERLAVFDFTGDQYHSWIRGPRVMVRGERGEIRDDELRYLEDHRTPVTLRLLRQDAGQYADIQGHHHLGILAGADRVYRNPFPGARLNDDEIAVAACLEGMATYVETGADIYSFAEAAQDQYLALSIAAARASGEVVRTTTQPWAPQP